MRIQRLSPGDAAEAAAVHRTAFDERLPWLAGLHTPDQDRAFFHEHVFTSCSVHGAFADGRLVGIIAFREGWIDQLYVLPQAQGQGIGSALLERARAVHDHLSLWTFQRNLQARSFYEAKGFERVAETDGSDNEEREPDVLYRWTRRAGSGR